MKLLICVCALLAVEAAKLQGYETPHSGSGGVLLPTLSRSSNSVFTVSVGSHHEDPHTTGGHFSQQEISSLSSNRPSFEHQQTPLTPIGTFNRPKGPSFSGPQLSVTSQHTTQAHHAGLDRPSFNGQISGSHIQAGVSPTGPSGPIDNFPLESFVDDQQQSCPEGQLRHLDGTCITPEITRNVFVYAAPAQQPTAPLPPIDVPLPKEEHNIVFIRTQDRGEGPEPIIIPPPQKKHLIYVLNKDSGSHEPKVIEVPAPEPKEPEVYFVNYADGENPTLPNGIDFETALNSAVHGEGQVIGGSHGVAPVTGEHGLVSNLGTGSEDGRSPVGLSGSGFTLLPDSDSSDEYFNTGNGIVTSFGVSSDSPQNFISNGRFTNGNDNGIVGPSITTHQAPLNNGAVIPQRFSSTFGGSPTASHQAPTNNGAAVPQSFTKGAVGPSIITHQAPSNNGAVIPQRLSPTFGGSPTASNQAPTNNGAPVSQSFTNGVVGPSITTHQVLLKKGAAIPQRSSTSVGGSAAATHQASSKNGAAVPQRFYSSP